VVGLVLFGVALRVAGTWTDAFSLWLDEALWAKRLVSAPLHTLTIRPIGLMWTTKQLVTFFGATEFWLRLPSLLGSVLTLALAPYVASQLLESKRARVLLVFLFALQPALIDFAKEFKPYSFEVFVHVLPVALYLRHRQTGRPGPLFALCALLPALFLFAYNLAFAFPSLLLLACHAAYRAERRSRSLAIVIVSGALCLVTVAVVYRSLLVKVHREGTADYWGDKYGVFYTDEAKSEATSIYGRVPDGLISWTLTKYADMAAIGGLRRDRWKTPDGFPVAVLGEWRAIERLGWLAFSLLGTAALVRARRFRELALLLGPLLPLIAANWLGKWPLGAFRTNLFICVYMLPLAALGFEAAVKGAKWRGRIAAAWVLLVTVLPGFAFGFDWHLHKRTWTRDHHARAILTRLYELRSEELAKDPQATRERLFLDLHTSETHEYYLEVHPEFRSRFAAFFAKNFQTAGVSGATAAYRGKLTAALSRGGESIWVVVSRPADIPTTRQALNQAGRILHAEQFGEGHALFHVSPK
jgi:hypothetical protein